MTLTLLVALVSSQVIYEWVDAKGQSHFTDDRGSIPQGVKPRETKGGEVSVVKSTPPAPVAQAAEAADAGVEEEETMAPDACAVAQNELNQAEEWAATEATNQQQREEEETLQCGNVLLTHGQGSFAQCMAGRSEALTQDQSAVQNRVEVAREMLEQAQRNGCR